MKLKYVPIILMSLLAGAAFAQPVFQVGNLNPPVPPSVPDLHMGQESYAYLFYPPDYASCSQGGFKLEVVHMLMEFMPDQVPVTFQASAGLFASNWDPSQNMFVPEGPLCEGSPMDFHFTEPGQYVIVLPVDDACQCQPFDDHYFLTVHYPDPFNANLPIDGQPEPGVVFNTDGGAWLDMINFDKTAGGKVIIWGDLVCCDPSIGHEDSTWGGIKGLYR